MRSTVTKGAAAQKMQSAFGLGAAAELGRNAAWSALHRTSDASPGASDAGGGPPAWARALRHQQTSRHRRQVAIHALSQGDRGGGSAIPDIKERND